MAKAVQHHFDATVAATVENARTTRATITFIECSSPNAAAVFLQLFNATAANVTLGTTVPTYSFFIPATGAMDKIAIELAFGTALSYAVTTTATGSTAAASNCILNIGLN